MTPADVPRRADDRDELPEDDLDGAWKEALGRFFPDLLALLFPGLHAAVDWAAGFESLETELRALAPGSETGRRHVDALFRVTLRSGGEAWLLVHVEVQGWVDPAFPERLFVYNYRIRDRYARPVVSLAVLADADPAWRPDSYVTGVFGCQHAFRFPAVKLLDHEARWDDLERDPNPFAVVVMAHLRALRSKGDPERRLAHKLALLRGLFQRGLTREQVGELLRLLDWLLALPPAHAARCHATIRSWEGEGVVPFVTSFERLAKEEGHGEGLAEGLLRAVVSVLEARFGAPLPGPLLEAVRGLRDADALERATRAAAVAPDLEAFARTLGA